MNFDLFSFHFSSTEAFLPTIFQSIFSLDAPLQNHLQDRRQRGDHHQRDGQYKRRVIRARRHHRISADLYSDCLLSKNLKILLKFEKKKF